MANELLPPDSSVSGWHWLIHSRGRRACAFWDSENRWWELDGCAWPIATFHEDRPGWQYLRPIPAAETLDRLERIEEAMGELLAVAQWRGDDALPHPSDDPKLNSARMQAAWDEAHEAHGPDLPDVGGLPVW